MKPLISVLKNPWFPFIFAIPLFFCVYHYNGIVMDAILYVTQYVFSIDPLRFSGDPSFAFGNQNSLGFFSPFFGLFLESFGVSSGAFVFTLLMQIAWVIAFVFLVKNLLRLAWCRLWMLPVIIVLVCIFSNGMPFSRLVWFHFLSSYACSRALSIVFGMGGIAFLLNRKKYLSIVFILIGTLVHPITAGWCLPFWCFYFFPKTRIPIIALSISFPLTCLFHYGVFDTYPIDWLSKPLAFGPRHEIIARNVFFVVFFGIMAKKHVNRNVQNLSRSMLLLIIIAFFFDLWGGLGEHILLYQVQPWRALWLPSIVAAPLSVCSIVDLIKRFVRKRIVSTNDLGYVFLFASFFSQENIIIVSILSAVFLMVEKKTLSIKEISLVYAGFLLGGYIIQQYITWILDGFPVFFDYSIVGLYHIKNSFFVYQFLFTIFFSVYFLKKRQFVSALLLVISIFAARFMLLPVLSFFMYFVSKKKNRKYWGGVLVIVMLIIVDGVVDVDARNQFPVHGLPASFFQAVFLAAVSFASIYLAKFIYCKGIYIWVMMCCVIALICYNNQSADWRGKERQLNNFFHEAIFPQIEDRGGILFFVSGDYVESPRLQFMTGCYFDKSIKVGSIFYKEQYRYSLERSHLLYWKDRAPKSAKFFEYADILAKIADRDTLIDRVEFLCKKGEIHHLVTDEISLPFVKEDSMVIGNTQKVYLYTCPLDL